MLGTAAYLAPEQASGAEVGPQADLYGLGVVTYQLLAGRLPYDAASLTELALMQQREYPMRLDELDPVIPQALAIAVQRALSLEPEQRYPSAEEMRRALHDGARGVAPAARRRLEPPRRRCCRADDSATRARRRDRRPSPRAACSRRPRAPRRRRSTRPVLDAPSARAGATRAAPPGQSRPRDRLRPARRPRRRRDRVRDRQPRAATAR